ncbi:8736_t:CDS:2 [Funneliformis geosporum]|uniref:8736_t:CDS:1 n=1 Tax=Funneliformis geosporum TaxID=1117311 RepID=A0A9W4ST36_9GLOM|nr:8736_t:CDS:2 [Funneliformis geosporum]
MSSLDRVDKLARYIFSYSFGVFWSIVCVGIPILIEKFIKRKEVFVKKDRSNYESRLYTECSDFGQHKTLEVEGKSFHYFESGDVSKPLILFLHVLVFVAVSTPSTSRYGVSFSGLGYGAGGSFKPREVHNYNANLLLADIREIIQKLTQNGRAECLAAAQSWEWDQYQDHSGYIDRLIILNGPHTGVVALNVYSRFNDVFHYRNLKSLISNPISTITNSWKSLQPCFDQALKSFYVGIFMMPSPIGETWFSIKDFEIYEKILKTLPSETMTEEDINLHKAVFCANDLACLTGGLNYYRSNAARGFFEDQKRRGIKQPGFIGIPTLVIWGDQDRYLNKDLCTLNLEKLVSNLKIVHIPEAQHFVQEECPDKTNDIMRRFITSQGNLHDLDENKVID